MQSSDKIFQIEEEIPIVQQLGLDLTAAYLRDLENLKSLEKPSEEDSKSVVSFLEETPLEEKYPQLFKVIEENVENIDDAQEKILKLMLKVFEKLGEDKLRKIKENKDIAMFTKFFEFIGHYFNKLCRCVSLGYGGYEFSDKEAREAIADNFPLHDPTKMIDENTRFAQVAKSEGIIMKETIEYQAVRLDEPQKQNDLNVHSNSEMQNLRTEGLLLLNKDNHASSKSESEDSQSQSEVGKKSSRSEESSIRSQKQDINEEAEINEEDTTITITTLPLPTKTPKMIIKEQDMSIAQMGKEESQAEKLNTTFAKIEEKREESKEAKESITTCNIF